jgi:type I restriction enzyme M protein
MAPFLAEVERQKAEAVTLKDRLAALRKADTDTPELNACRAEIAAAEKAARDAQAKADAIDAAVYDLKAVNPRAVADTDTRSTEEVIESIESHGQTIRDALARLKALMSVTV